MAQLLRHRRHDVEPDAPAHDRRRIALAERQRSVEHAGARELETSLDVAPSSRWLDPSTWATTSDKPSIAEQLAEFNFDCGKADNDRIGGWAGTIRDRPRNDDRRRTR